MSPSAECGHWSIFTLSKNPRREVGGWLRAQRKGLTLQRLDLGLQLGDALTLLAHVAMTMQSPLSPAADMPPDGPGQRLISTLPDDAVTLTCRLFETASINDLKIATAVVDEPCCLKHSGDHCNSRSSQPE